MQTQTGKTPILSDNLFIALVVVVSLLVGYWLGYADYQPWAETGRALSTVTAK